MDVKIEVLPLYYDYALEATHDVVILVGGRNSGKSHFMEQLSVLHSNNKKDYKMVVVTGVETNVEAGVKEGILDRIDDFKLNNFYEERKIPPKIIHRNGNEILFKGFKSTRQQKKFKELKKVTAIWYEEAEDITYEEFKALQNQLRGGNKKDRRLYLSLNPVNPDGFIDTTFFQKKPHKVFEYFEDGRPKVFEVNLPIELENETYNINVLVVCSTFKDNKFLTAAQKAVIVEYKETRPDLWAMLGECKFTQPEGALLKHLNRFSLSKLDLNQASRITAIVDTATSGDDNATLGIYAEFDDEHHYLIDAFKDDGDADTVIPQMIQHIKKWKPQTVHVEKNHEGLYFKTEIDKHTPSSIIVKDFFSSENKHKKILGQSGRMREHLYVRDDGDHTYNEFINRVMAYNKDEKKNSHDDCIDNVAMYFKHGNKKGWLW